MMFINIFKVGVLLAVMTAIFVGMGWLIGGTAGMAFAFVIAIGMNVFSFWNSDKLVLRMHGAEEVDAHSAPAFYKMVAELAHRAELPMPRVFIMHSAQPNAFATGRSPSHSAVCASTGLLEALNEEEVAGVMAHELAHIRNRDTLIMTVAATIAGAISMLANFMQFSAIFGGGRGEGGRGAGIIGTLVAIVVAPFAAMLVQMAISRSREYVADRVGAEICGNPLWLASALARIHKAAHQIPMESAEGMPESAHMFIINPLTGQGFDNLFSTHPNTANRIHALQLQAEDMAQHGTDTRVATHHTPHSPWERTQSPPKGRSGAAPWQNIKR